MVLTIQNIKNESAFSNRGGNTLKAMKIYLAGGEGEKKKGI